MIIDETHGNPSISSLKAQASCTRSEKKGCIFGGSVRPKTHFAKPKKWVNHLDDHGHAGSKD